jgi:uncharacterized membrane protein
MMEDRQSACSVEQSSFDALPTYDVMLPCCAARASQHIPAIGVAAAVVFLVLTGVCAKDRVVLLLALLGAAAKAGFMLRLRMRLESSNSYERIAMRGVGLRVRYVARGRLVEQRRLSLCKTAVEIHDEPDGSHVVLRLVDDRRKPARKIEIARCLTPSQRLRFLTAFLAQIRLAGIEPRVSRR